MKTFSRDSVTERPLGSPVKSNFDSSRRRPTHDRRHTS